MKVYAIKHLPTGAWMPCRMTRIHPGGWSYWDPTPAGEALGGHGFDKNPRIFFSSASAARALTAWLMGEHTRKQWSGFDWEGIPDGSDEHIVNAPATPRLRAEMSIVELELTGL